MLTGQKELFNSILNFDSAIYVEAPAGCGKTYACIKSVSILANCNKLKEFEKVLVLTFSKNARAQILNELSKYDKTDKIYKHIEISNYHSFYKKYLDRYRDLIGFKKNFTIVDDDEYKESYYIQKKFLSSKNDLIEFGDYYKINNKYYSSKDNVETRNKDIIDKYNEYYEFSKETGIITFNMFGILINDILDKSPILAKLISHDFPYIFLDEYQDTDDLQEYFLIRLFNYSKCVFFADPIQRIYSFKGASGKRLSNLKDIFKTIISIKFEENYRYKTKYDIIAILNNIRTGNKLNYDILTNGKVFDIPIKLKNASDLYTKLGKNYIPSSIYWSILKNGLIKRDIIIKKSICILVKTNELVNKLCLFFEEKKKTCHEISDSKYMLKLNIILKKYFTQQTRENIIKNSVLIYALCKHNRKIEDTSFEKISELTAIQIFRKRQDEFKNIIEIIKKYNLEKISSTQQQKMILEMIKLITFEKLNYSAFHFVANVMNCKDISEKNIDNIYIQRQYQSSYSTIKPGLYIANYYQCKGREFDEVIIILDPEIKDVVKNRNILYVINSRMKEKLFIGNFKFIGS